MSIKRVPKSLGKCHISRWAEGCRKVMCVSAQNLRSYTKCCGAGLRSLGARLKLWLLSIYHRLYEILQKKIMAAAEVFVNSTVTILIQLLKSKRNFFHKTIRSWCQSLNSDLRLRGAGAKINIFGSTPVAVCANIGKCFDLMRHLD